MIQYPAQLPLPLQEGYGLSTVDPMMATRLVTGRTRYRVVHDYVPTEARFNFNFSQKEAALFEGWYVYELKNGIEWFEMDLQTPLGMKKCRAHFKGIPQGGELTQITRWRYSAVIELRERPIYTEEEYLGAIIDMPLDQFTTEFQNILEKWHTGYFG
ncbi:hypothetical protein [Pseudomonas cremoricolorata]|uniref:Transposase n=1 Tax=Pseudomonas cremoricolorata TaxID=157783 RepID=A0A089WPM3_9PSED|nr:hypothetical protein [Pseudomonas cremoricolorata]AIR90531.1 transposase [Pseudomonas cremoricolorata]